MIYRRHGILAGLIFAIVAYIGSVGSRILEYAVTPAIYLIRASPVSAALSVMTSFKVTAFRVIGALKPAYRESYETDGLSLNSQR